jgi:ligand-binding sensor domain-containing protein
MHGWDRIPVSDIVEDAGEKLWVATTTGIYVIAKDGGIQRIAKEDGLRNEWVNALLLDKHNRLWAGTRNGLALMRDDSPGGKCGVRQVYTDKQGLVDNNAEALTEGTDGAIWIGTTTGISRLLPGSGPAVFQNFTRAHGLTDREITALATDRAGNIWAGTEGAGVMRIETAGFTTFREQDGLPSDRVWSVFADRIGTVLAVAFSETVRGWSVNIFDGVKFHAVVPKVFGARPTWGNNQILLQSRTGEWWAATDAGLCRYAPIEAASLAGRQPEACYAQDIFEGRHLGLGSKAQGSADAMGPREEGDLLV